MLYFAGNDGVKFVFDEAFETAVAEPRLALLRFAVLRQGTTVAQTVLPVHLMRPGLRWAQLYDPQAASGAATAEFSMTRMLLLVHRAPLARRDPPKPPGRLHAAAMDTVRKQRAMNAFKPEPHAASKGRFQKVGTIRSLSA